MWEYIVLGELPGTAIRLNFAGWLYGVALVIVGVAVIRVVRAALQTTDRPAAKQPATDLTVPTAAVKTRLLIRRRIQA